jgi:hypothetical protein
VGTEAIPPVNSIVFHKTDTIEQITNVPNILKKHNPAMKVIAIVQTGFAGEYMMIDGKRVGTDDIAYDTVQMVKNAGYDGIRISGHVNLPERPDAHIAKLRTEGVIVGHNARDSVDIITRMCAEAGILDVNNQYNRAIGEFPYALAAQNAQGTGLAGTFARMKEKKASKLVNLT